MSFRLSLATLAACTLLTLGCSTPLETFVCESNLDCVSEGEQGAICEPTSLCSFADSTCPDGQRYGDLAGSMSLTCVGEDDDSDADAGFNQPDSGDEPKPDGGGSVTDGSVSTSVDAATSCVDVTVTVFDNYLANDRVKILVNDVEVFNCQPDSLPEPNDTTSECTRCVPLGAQITLKSASVDRLSQFASDCNMSCGLQEKCEFTASVACSAVAVFDAVSLP